MYLLDELHDDDVHQHRLYEFGKYIKRECILFIIDV